MEIWPAHLSMHIKFCHFCFHGRDWKETKTKIDYTLWNLYEGSLSLEIDGQKMTASAGDVLFFHPGDTYTAFCNGDCCNFLVTFFIFDTGNCIDIFKKHNSAGIYSTTALKEHSDSFCRNFLDNHRHSDTVSLHLYALFLSFLTELIPLFDTQERFHIQPARTPDLKLNRLLDYMEDNMEKNISVSELASIMGMSEKYFIQYFHSHTGSSPKQYRIRQRMNHSVRLLADPGLTLSEIAFRMDYSDQYAFSKAFKAYYGESPGTFRKHFLADANLPGKR